MIYIYAYIYIYTHTHTHTHIYFAIGSLTHSTSASCVNDYSRYLSTQQKLHIYIYLAIGLLTHTSASCVNDYSRYLSTQQLRCTGIRKTILYQDLNNIKQVLNNLNNTLKICNRNKTSQNKIMGLKVVLLYMHIFYTLMIQL
jgi:hypothetical protein